MEKYNVLNLFMVGMVLVLAGGCITMTAVMFWDIFIYAHGDDIRHGIRRVLGLMERYFLMLPILLAVLGYVSLV